jgi:hypothetical protein
VGLVGNEGIEVGVGEHPALALATATDADIGERTGCDVALEGLDRAAELGGRLALGAKAVRRCDARLARLALAWSCDRCGRSRQEMTFVFLPVLCQDVLCQDLGEHGSFRLRQRLAIGLRLRLSQEGLHLLLGQFVVVAHLSCCSLCGDPRIGTLDSTQNTGDFRQFVSHRSRRRRWNAAQSHAAGRVVRKTGDGLLAPGQTATRGLLDGSVARYKLLLLRRQQFKLPHQARITQKCRCIEFESRPS